MSDSVAFPRAQVHAKEEASQSGLTLRRWLERRTLEPALVVITLAAILLSFVVDWAGLPGGVISALAVVAYVAGGFYGVQASFVSLRARRLDIDFLMILAAIGAALVGQWRDGAVLLFLFSLSNVLQDYANTSSAGSIIAFHKFSDDLAAGSLGVICSFGAGYSAGSVIVRKIAAAA